MAKFITWKDYAAPIPNIIVNVSDIKMVIRTAWSAPPNFSPEYLEIDAIRPYRIFFRDGRYLDITRENYDLIKAALTEPWYKRLFA